MIALPGRSSDSDEHNHSKVVTMYVVILSEMLTRVSCCISVAAAAATCGRTSRSATCKACVILPLHCLSYSTTVSHRTYSMLLMTTILLCGRPNRPHYGSCPTVRLSVCLSVTNELLTRKRKSMEKPKLVRTFPRAGVTSMKIFSLKGHRPTGA